jgi:PAS domain S-box-containing protein
MTQAARTFRWLSYRAVVVLVLLVGVCATVASYRHGRRAEAERAESEFTHRASLRHALVREILGHYEDALFGLSALFVSSEAVTLSEFNQATQRIAGRISGVQAFQWVPRVPARERAATEAKLSRDYGRAVELVEFTSPGRTRRAAVREEHLPISYVHPLAGNEVALGYDLMSGPTIEHLKRARATRQMVVSHPFRLVQEVGSQLGVVMIWPVYRRLERPEANAVEEFSGFLQCVFRVHDLLETAHGRHPATVFDMLFVDASETDPARRILYHRPGDDSAPRGEVSEAEFRRGPVREHALPFGGRDWRVLFRPRERWLEDQRTSMPLLRSGSFLLLSALVAGIVAILGRREETVRRLVDERTGELAESRRQLASMLHALPGMAYRCTYEEQLNVIFLSEGARELTGWTAEEFTSGVAHFRDCIHPDDLARVRDVTRGALQEQNDVEVEYRIVTRSGQEKWVLSRGRGVYSADGALRFFEGLAIDITAQKQAETARLSLERKLLEGQKLESLGLLAGGIAHDFNNLLSSILGNASLARLSLPAPTDTDGPLRAIEAASLRAAELCRQMLAYAGKGRFVIEPIDLTALVEDLLPLLKISVAQQGTLQLQLARGLPAVSADATQIRQVLMNLVLNAADAITGRRGEITLTTGVVRVDGELLARCVAGAGLPGGDYVSLEVSDNGIGMAPEVLAKIFDPFFTTKFAGRGLGLAAVLGIVRGHHGALHVQSTPDAGSSFRLFLPPVAIAPAPLAPAEPPRAARASLRGKVLVVDDEGPVRLVTTELLRSYGIAAVPAESGAEAVEVFRQRVGEIDLVLLDLLMPGMTGEQVLAALRELRPDVRVLLMSGYAEGDVLGRLAANAGKLGFIAKPFTRAALEAKLREMLA